MRSSIFISLLAIVALSFFLTVYQQQLSPPCFSTDEAAFGYNAYSLLKTGKDEYGKTLPLRLESFGDYKLPLYSYLSVPFVKVFGLNETSTRMVNLITMSLLPLAVFFLAKELFNDDRVGIIAAFLVATSLGLHILGRQAHEGLLAVFFITITSLFFIRFLKYRKLQDTILFLASAFLALFSYHLSRVPIVFLILYAIFYIWQKNQGKKILVLLIAALILFFLPDFLYPPARVKNLLFFNNIGYSLKINELRAEGGNRLFYNKITSAVPEVINQYLVYFSPQFLINIGDENMRFGFSGMGPITVIEYIGLGIGLYYIFKNKKPWRYFLLLLLFIAPLSASLSWAGVSLTRSVFMFIPLSLIVAYGYVQLLQNIHKKYFSLTAILLASTFLLFLAYHWDFYLFHYPKRALTIHAWQCGNREMANYIKTNYNRFDNFYITRRNGQPYIFLLFYLGYSPEKYQKQATLSTPDEFGFGQVEKFDKFIFHFEHNPSIKNAAFIGYPDEFGTTPFDPSKMKKIKAGTEEMFWIYEN